MKEGLTRGSTVETTRTFASSRHFFNPIFKFISKSVPSINNSYIIYIYLNNIDVVLFVFNLCFLTSRVVMQSNATAVRLPRSRCECAADPGRPYEVKEQVNFELVFSRDSEYPKFYLLIRFYLCFLTSRVMQIQSNDGASSSALSSARPPQADLRRPRQPPPVLHFIEFTAFWLAFIHKEKKGI